eukprot:m51a1_g11565 putative glycosyltransferase 10 family protein (844) ;mRNA; f:3792-9630
MGGKSAYTLKVTVDPGGEIHRVPVPALAYDDVRSRIASRLAPARLVAIKYIDEDGDKVTVALQEELEAVPRAVTVTEQLATQEADVLNAVFSPINETNGIDGRLNFTSHNCEFRLFLLNQRPWVLKMSKSEVSNVKVLRERSIYLDINNQKSTEAIPKVLAPRVAPASYCGRACLFVECFQYDLSERTWSDEELLDTCCWCVAGLEAIHNAGFCHGDVAPTNIWARLSPSGEWAFAVGDLGESVPLGWPVRITTEPYALKDLERTGSFAYDFLIEATVHLTSKWIEPSILLITKLVGTGKPICCAIPFSASLYGGPSPRLDFSEITLCSEIGRGATATVYRALYREQQVAVKLLKNLENQQDRLDDFERESAILEQLCHPCVIEFRGAVHLRGREAIVSEYLSHGSLQQAIPHLSYGMRLKCLVDSANGMKYLHESRVMHRDLKPGNHLRVCECTCTGYRTHWAPCRLTYRAPNGTACAACAGTTAETTATGGPATREGPVVVARWNPQFDDIGFYRQELARGCGVPAPCVYTDDRAALAAADALVFSIIYNAALPPPGQRPPGQLYVAHCMEPVTSYFGRHLSDAAYMRQFDVRVTYQSTSDVPVNYFFVELWQSQRADGTLPPVRASEKRGLAVWVAHVCETPNRRVEYVRQLMRHVRVDSYGRCLHNADFPFNDTRHGDGWPERKERVIAPYKFTLAFENSNARDYVTEKFFQPLMAGSVPVVMGAPNVREYAPSEHSYIDVADFASPKELADYLLMLDRNDTLYERHGALPPQPRGSGLTRGDCGDAPRITLCRYHSWRRGAWSQRFGDLMLQAYNTVPCRLCRHVYEARRARLRRDEL